jgi:PIN domain nuclease of toxin-antitoxin system
MRYLADTHAFLWLLFDDARLSADADRLLIAQARASGCAVLTSDPRFAAYDVQVAW